MSLHTLFELTRQAEEATRLSQEAQSSVALRVRMLESNMRLVNAYGNASETTQRMVEGAVVERHRRRQNILRGHVDSVGRPFDVSIDDDVDEDIRSELTREGFVYVAGAPGERSYYVNASVAAVVPQEEDEEPVWYYRRAREMALEDAEWLQDDLPAGDLQATEWEVGDAVANDALPRRNNDASLQSLMEAMMSGSRSRRAMMSGWARQSVRTDLKALLHAVQQKLEVEQERAASGQIFSEGSYLELTDLLRDMFLVVERI